MATDRKDYLRQYARDNRARLNAYRRGYNRRKGGERIRAHAVAPTEPLTEKLSRAILTCLTRDELIKLVAEAQALIADPNYTPKPFTL